ncbi:hypothetical protein M3A49_26725 [Paraburkholderia sp. CNPSo 3076]|uniref:hypothetical protein n=1 Tax=Paraburkholderia sp. CNPSo 3076 TaxID=2940936 RepID=UPI00224D1700|nr:hypothetical protein [Paraburkholderia sp. CNPSo 3076]MCX5543040.1 hypothetical protein [Paraburkholderia sp. CNPSo 3076]
MFRNVIQAALVAASLTIAAASAHAAGVIATMPNTSGGRIELSDIPCPAGSGTGSIAHSYGSGADDLYGCYTHDENTGTVTVNWQLIDGIHVRTYAVTDFYKTPYSEQRLSAAKRATTY